MKPRARARATAIEWQGSAIPFLTTMATLAGFCAMLLRFG
jgi:hypothetical protein